MYVTIIDDSYDGSTW